MAQLVTASRDRHIAICTLNQPEKRNPISREMREDLMAAMEPIQSDDSVRSVIITGAGKAFCSGLDLEALAAQRFLSPEQHRAESQSVLDFFEYILHYPKPTIAAVNGPAVAGGCGLALLCDLTIASSEAFFCYSEVKVGFVPATVGVYMERIFGPKLSREMLLTARRIPAPEAHALGLINEAVPPAELQHRAIFWGEQIGDNGPEAVKMTKNLLLRARDLSLNNGLALAVEINARARTTEECHEGVRAFLEKRQPAWKVSGR